MTPERFEGLADAWGADLQRWPEAERAAARGLLAREPGLQAMLAHAAALDAVLDAHRIAAPGAGLVRGVLDAAAASSPRRPQARSGRPRIGWWWSGAGAAGLGLAGAAAGVLAVSMALTAAMPASHPSAGDGGWASTAFDRGGAADWSDE